MDVLFVQSKAKRRLVLFAALITLVSRLVMLSHVQLHESGIDSDKRTFLTFDLLYLDIAQVISVDVADKGVC